MIQKILNGIKFISILFLVSGLVYWMRSELGLLFPYSDDFYFEKNTQTYNDISLSKGNYRLGFYIGKISVIREKNDADYLLEYSCDGEVVRKKNNMHIKKNGEVLYDSSDGHTMIFIDKFNIPNDVSCRNFDLKITTEKNFSLFKKLNVQDPTTLYIKKSEYASHFEQVLSEERKKFRAKYPNDFDNVPIEHIEDTNATKQALIDSLLGKDFKKFQSLLEKDHLSVNIELGEDDYSKQTKRTPLFYAAYTNDLQTVTYLLKQGADIHHRDFIKKTALQYAIENNATRTVKYLLDNGADENDACYVFEYSKHVGRSRTRKTPLVYSAKNEYYELFKILLEHDFRKTDIDCKGLDLSGADDAFTNAMRKVEYKGSKKNDNNPFTQKQHESIYHCLYSMQYPVRFLKLYKQYNLKDEEYEKTYTQEWFEQYYEKCKTGIYGGKCIFLNESNITLEKFDDFKYFELVGLENRKEKTINQGSK